MFAAGRRKPQAGRLCSPRHFGAQCLTGILMREPWRKKGVLSRAGRGISLWRKSRCCEEPQSSQQTPATTSMSTTPRFLVCILAASSAPAWVAAAEPTKEQLDFFENKIRPILTDKCYKCHSVESGKSKGGLTLDTKPGWEKGGDAGPAVVPGNVEKSPLHKALTYADKDLQMPPSSSGGKLADNQIADIAAWIKMGAPDPRATATKVKRSGLTESARSHWAFREPGRYAIPNNKNQQWCRTPIDAYILQKLEEKGMFASPDADRETLLRRITFDLTGLPPTYAESEAFMNDTTANAYEKVVDRLLASPAYGERWARHWLDTARYADTIGGPRNAARTKQYRYADAWTYRDYVARAFNEDKPYTDFIIEQIAADKIPGIQPDDARLAALGFLTVGERFPNANDVINDRIDVVSKGFLGLTVACARCHDHMFDPIPTRDYYALHGVFSSITEPDQKPLIGSKVTPQQRQEIEQLGVRWFFRHRAEVVWRRHEALAEMVHPHAVHDHARGERVFLRRDALREFVAAAALGEWHGLAVGAEDLEEAARHDLTARLCLAANEDR